MKYYAYMQHIDKKTLKLRHTIANQVKELRMNKNTSCNKFEHEYDFSRGSINRIENGNVDCKVISLWKIAEALGIKLSELISLIEEKLGDDFKLIDE